MIDRRHFLRGLLAAPAIVAIGNIMPVRALWMPTVEVVERGVSWRIQHIGTQLSLGYCFDREDDAAKAARQINRLFDVDRIALQVRDGSNYESARNALYAIQGNAGGERLGKCYAPGSPEMAEARQIIHAWATGAQVTNSQRGEP